MDTVDWLCLTTVVEGARTGLFCFLFISYKKKFSEKLLEMSEEVQALVIDNGSGKY